MFVGRTSDLAFLEKCYAKPDAQLVVMYGRRRVGKTECLRRFAQGKQCVWYSCTRDTDVLQLRGFSRRLLAQNATASRLIDSYSSWQLAFEQIPHLETPGRKLVIIDEFPYAVGGNAALPSILQNVWDETLMREDVMVVLCGSSVSFMEDELLAEKNPLYGRATGIWKMKELGYNEAAEFFPNYAPQQKLEAYGILGGIPYYLRQFDPSLDIDRNVCENVLSRGCALYSEAEFLLREELREPAVYNALLSAVASGETVLNGIAQKTMLDPRTAMTYLNKLKGLCMVEREFSVDAGVQEKTKSSRGLWRVSDNFLKFWYASAHPFLSELDAGDTHGVWSYSIKPMLNTLLADAFEEVCRQWLRRRNMSGELPFRYVSMGRWWYKANEIDLVASGAKAQKILGECKFKNAPQRADVLNELKAKGATCFPNSELWYWLFSKNGFADSELWVANDSHVRLIDAVELEE